MVFNSLSYMIFLPLVYLAFYLCRDGARWLVLLLASVFFYASLGVPYLPVVLLVLVLHNYVSGILLVTVSRDDQKRLVFWGGVLGNVSILVALKYLPVFFSKPLVSIGISYLVFQAVSYITDVYLEIAEPERHLGYFALYLSFFPKLLQGPIERPGGLLPQIRKPYVFDYDNMRTGMLLFAWGLLKKVVIADRLAFFVDGVFNDVHAYSGLALLFATYLYAIQILFDFSGYTDMALGAARLFNIQLTQNFNSPYLSTSVAEFWRRWHISFSRWILDYLFKPLQMQWRAWRNSGTALALLVAFLVSGVWHGATLGFLIWGFLHGLYLAGSVFYRPVQKAFYKKIGLEKTRVQRVWQTFVTFNLVCFAWIFFRANSLSDAGYVITNMFNGVGNISAAFWDNKGQEFKITAFLLTLIAVWTLCRHMVPSVDAKFYRSKSLFRWSIYVTLVLVIMLFNTTGTKSFIYFNF